MNKKALIAMSGGVDSSAAAFLMKNQGFECSGATLKLHQGGTEENDAVEAAHKLGIPHHVFDFGKAFTDEVIKPFINAYEAGLTPNPCIFCNRSIKFGRLFLKARELNFDLLATGHYARIKQDPSGRWLLKKALDEKKDQSYVLYCLSQDQLGHICFPLGDLRKDEVRTIAREQGLVNPEKQESQDICFIPNGDYGAFMEQYTGKTYPPGDIINTEGKPIGRHRGLVRYTLGQRRGLGVAANVPVYVVAKNSAANTVTLGAESFLFGKTLIAQKINLIACDTLDKPLRLMVKTRYLQQEKAAMVTQTGPDEIRVEFEEGQRAITPGQAAVFYDGDTVVGGGTIV